MFNALSASPTFVYFIVHAVELSLSYNDKILFNVMKKVFKILHFYVTVYEILQVFFYIAIRVSQNFVSVFIFHKYLKKFE